MPLARSASYNSSVEAIRAVEYPMLKDSVYLDHAGATLCAKSLLDRFHRDMMTDILGNPHSGSYPSQLATSCVEDVRLKLLTFFNASPHEFDLVFVANATAGAKLIAEGLRCMPGGFRYIYHEACHTSLVGIREEATFSSCLDDRMVNELLEQGRRQEDDHENHSTTLFAYSGQSHMNGQRYPQTWASQFRNRFEQRTGQTRVYTLLDASSLAATSPLDLTDDACAPDFLVVSLYKIFGFPDIGALIVRRDAEGAFRHRRYFGGGTVDLVTCGREQWHVSKSQFLHERLEDGTLPFHSILALDAAIDTHKKLWGNMRSVASHTQFLRQRLFRGLSALQHSNGNRVCEMYSKGEPDCAGSEQGEGPVVSFNIRSSRGAWISVTQVEKLANVKSFYLRTGGLCSPGSIAAALKLEPWQLRENFSAGYRCGTENDIVSGKPTGVIRASLGAMSSISDVDRFVSFVDEFYSERDQVGTDLLLHTAPQTQLDHERRASLEVRSITVFPIKSCGGYTIPRDREWEVLPEGLAWDREWCLLHRGSGQALSQKRYPKMALLSPSLDFGRGVLLVRYRGLIDGQVPDEVTVPLSADPTVFDDGLGGRHGASTSRICGERVSARIYSASEINGFFSTVLGVQCVLARFPPGGEGSGVRYAKARMQKHQRRIGLQQRHLPGAFPELPSPPDSDSEITKRRILLSNESPILVVHTASIDALNRDIEAAGGRPVSPDSFRANIVVGPRQTEECEGESGTGAYEEDFWEWMTIGAHQFRMLGSCGRCQMVCVDQNTGGRGDEPYITLAKTRSFEGKVFFGAHMCHIGSSQHPTIRVSDLAFAQ